MGPAMRSPRHITLVLALFPQQAQFAQYTAELFFLPIKEDTKLFTVLIGIDPAELIAGLLPTLSLKHLCEQVFIIGDRLGWHIRSTHHPTPNVKSVIDTLLLEGRHISQYTTHAFRSGNTDSPDIAAFTKLTRGLTGTGNHRFNMPPHQAGHRLAAAREWYIVDIRSVETGR